jgi:hypothetical protein
VAHKQSLQLSRIANNDELQLSRIANGELQQYFNYNLEKL